MTEKVRKRKELCGMGNDVTSNMFLYLPSNDLVGKLEFVKLSRFNILECVGEKWKPLLKTLVRVVMLMNG